MDAAGWAAIAAWAGFAATAATVAYTAVLVHRAGTALAETRKTREAAQDQAHHARVSARAASLAADAAIDSARSDRESIAIARATFDRDERPTFEATFDEPQDGRFLAAVMMLTGPPEVVVNVRWAASSEGPDENGTRRFDHQTGMSSAHRLVQGDRIKMQVGVPSWADEGTIRLDLSCTDAAEETRKWTVPHVLEWTAPPRPRVRWLN